MERSFLVPWFLFSLNGGIARFLRLGRVLRARGVELSFASLLDRTETPWPGLRGRILTRAEAFRRSWDGVMVPGAGAPPELLERLAPLREPRFGVRVQHVLNDPSRRHAFESANRALRPHVVVFNNRHWSTGEWRGLSGETFHEIPGAVDTVLHRPEPGRPFPRRPPRWEVGALASKNLPVILEAAARLPDTFRFHLFGAPPPDPPPLLARLVDADRVRLHGALAGEALARFYRSLDAVVTVEVHAGWCNTAAEGFAHGLPCVVTPAGTREFARHGETCLVMAHPTAPALAEHLRALARDPARAAALGRAAARAVAPFSWEAYADRLLPCLERPAFPHYFRAPALGLFGRHPVAHRLEGLAPLFARTAGASLLDLGCAEGLVSLAFAREGGAARIHGFDVDPGRTAFARHLFSREAGGVEARFRTADLERWTAFLGENRDLLLPAYDVVLFLGLYHHLSEGARRETLEGALDRCGRWFALRTPRRLVERDDLEGILRNRGFRLLNFMEGAAGRGWFGIFEKEPLP